MVVMYMSVSHVRMHVHTTHTHTHTHTHNTNIRTYKQEHTHTHTHTHTHITAYVHTPPNVVMKPTKITLTQESHHGERRRGSSKGHFRVVSAAIVAPFREQQEYRVRCSSRVSSTTACCWAASAAHSRRPGRGGGKVAKVKKNGKNAT